jgi:hypothetical protein
VAFNRMKRVMSTCQVLSLPYFTQPFVMECDTSSEGIGVVLMQNRHLITFKRRKLREPEKIFSINDKERLAIMHALAKFIQYLVGGRFMVHTEHKNLRYFLEQWDLNERQHKWASKVKAYDFYIEYVQGKNNLVVYALSRRPTAFSMIEISIDWKFILLVEYSNNTFTCEVMEGSI